MDIFDNALSSTISAKITMNDGTEIDGLYYKNRILRTSVHGGWYIYDIFTDDFHNIRGLCKYCLSDFGGEFLVKHEVEISDYKGCIVFPDEAKFEINANIPEYLIPKKDKISDNDMNLINQYHNILNIYDVLLMSCDIIMKKYEGLDSLESKNMLSELAGTYANLDAEYKNMVVVVNSGETLEDRSLYMVSVDTFYMTYIFRNMIPELMEYDECDRFILVNFMEFLLRNMHLLSQTLISEYKNRESDSSEIEVRYEGAKISYLQFNDCLFEEGDRVVKDKWKENVSNKDMYDIMELWTNTFDRFYDIFDSISSELDDDVIAEMFGFNEYSEYLDDDLI